ncbi:hypothetical protein NEIG_01066 [Nematocida sp. ERTm5]|nr:hypothetical protein NEIG_01066 [Nematocida sp. ERTm5]
MVRESPWYIYEFKAYTKERWVGCKLVDVLAAEFKRRTRLYFVLAVASGSIQINGNSVTDEYVLKHGDLITHKTHRHEPPIPTDEIDILYEDSDVLVVDKPSGIPCHPNSSYNKHTLTEILKKKCGLSFVSAQNRLDKQTSGVVILAKSSKAAVKYHKKIEEKEGFKIYLCKVLGEFPECEVIVKLPLSISRKTCTTTVFQEDGIFQGKPSITIFRRVSVENGESILACGLVTGRTHQIRVHLQAIGYPIIDDMIYGTPYIRKETLINRISKIKESSGESKSTAEEINTENNNNPTVENKPLIECEITDSVYLEMAEEEGEPLTRESVKKFLTTEDCRTDNFQDDETYLETISTDNTSQFIMDSCMHCRNPESLSTLPKFSTLSLHAWKYSLEENVFTTALPEWCTEEINDSLCKEIEQTKNRLVSK